MGHLFLANTMDNTALVSQTMPGAPLTTRTYAPLRQTMVVEEETYCGPISLVIGLFLFPCICFCPLDKMSRTTVLRGGMCGEEAAWFMAKSHTEFREPHD